MAINAYLSTLRWSQRDMLPDIEEICQCLSERARSALYL
jgi:hypothetical protein